MKYYQLANKYLISGEGFAYLKVRFREELPSVGMVKIPLIAGVIKLPMLGNKTQCMVILVGEFSQNNTPLKFNIAPEKWWLEAYFPIGFR